MRRLIMGFLVLAAAAACADDPITPDPPEPGPPLADIIRTGGIDIASNSGSVQGSNWPPGLVGDEAWVFPFGFGPRDDRCFMDGRCAVGDQVDEFGNLDGPPESPHPVPDFIEDRSLFGYIATQQFYADTGTVDTKVARDDEHQSACSIRWSQRLTGTVTLRVRNAGAGTHFVLASN